MSTYVQIVNGVLRRLRENPVTDFDDNEYSTLIGKFVNDAKEEIEDLWDWTCLRQNLTFNTVNGTTSYVVTNSNERTKILRVFNTTNTNCISKAPDDFIDRGLQLSNSTAGIPTWYRRRGIDSSTGSIKIDLYPTPDNTYTIVLPSVVPQATLTSSSTVLTIPSRPVEFLAWALAVRERGEQGGTSAAEASSIALDAIRAAITLDTSYMPEELVWRVV